MKYDEQILNTVLAMTDAFHRGDMDGILGAYEAGAVVVGEPGQPLSGTTELRRMFEGYIAARPRFEYAGHEVIQAGDLAVHLAPWEMTGMAPDGTHLKMTGLSVAVLRKQPDGSWLMAIDQPFGDSLLPRPGVA